MTNQKKFDEKGVDYILGDSEIVSLSSRASDGDDEDHFFIDHDQVNKNDDHGSNSAVVIELEPLRQPLNGRRYRAETHEDVGNDTDNEHNQGNNGGVDHSEDQPKKNGIRIFLAVKATHFLFGGGQVSLTPFLPVYMSYLGLSVIEIGTVTTLGPFFGVVASLLCGTISDKFSKHKAMLLMCLYGTAIVYGNSVFMPFLLPQISTGINSHHTELNATNSTCNTGQIFSVFYRQHLNMTKGIPPCKFQNVTYSEFKELVDENACKFSNIKILNTSTAAAFLEDILECSFISLATDTDSDRENRGDENMDGAAPDDTCVFHDDLSKACEYQYHMHVIECNKYLLVKCNNSSFSKALLEIINGTTQLLDQGNYEIISQEGNYDIFVIMFLICVIGRMFQGSAETLIDTFTITLIDEYKETGQNFQYGRQRMFASIAYGALAPLSGIAVSAYTAAHPNAFNSYLPAFVLFITLFALCAATVSFIPIRVKQRTTKSLARDAKDVLLKPKVIVFFTVMLSMGIMFAFIETYLFLFLAEIDGEATVMGLCLTVSCASEVVFLTYASKIREKIGHRTVLGIALIGFSLRSLGYSLLQNPWTVLPIELLHGITYGLMWPTAVFFIHQSSPPELAATMQSLTFSTLFGLGKGVGIILGGVIYDNFGARNLFRGSAILSFVTLVLYYIIDIILDKRERSHDKL
ncbi:major facilitator superfamily domain-containing protein 6-like protein B [Lytechinus variegatus]|uniref:major facilitator superfamily domain-containing protein 6-like protein B n=1 Tax=Lytechinus variegatus TaxID=7654 RepID=UPI001BB215E1|nr:major facilitator superfamily domain-containing protein 6-like protein B [Lytechinus variegatus]